MDAPLSRNALLVVTIVLEAALLLVAAVWIHFAHIELLPTFAYKLQPILFGVLTGCTTVALSFICLTVGKRISIFAELRKMSEDFLVPLMAKLNVFDMLVLSIISGFCEEVLFRGIIQAQLGIAAASVLFGIFHDPTFRQKGYVLLATVAGLALGYLYQSTGNLWSCITAHSLHNTISMLLLRYLIKPTTSKSDDEARSNSDESSSKNDDHT